jgi:transcriptional regulator with XRE-family HTH domain
MKKVLPPTGFGEKLLALRKARGLSRAALSELSGVHPHTIVKLERSESGGHFAVVCALADALGVSVAYFAPKRRATKRKK